MRLLSFKSGPQGLFALHFNKDVLHSSPLMYGSLWILACSKTMSQPSQALSHSLSAKHRLITIAVPDPNSWKDI